MFKPASATLWNLPNLSITYTSDCLTILIVLNAITAIMINKNNKNVNIHIVGSTIGTHIGPNVLGVAFFQK